MPAPTITAFGLSEAGYTHPATVSPATSPGLAVKQGDSVYVFIGYNNAGGTLSVESVADNQPVGGGLAQNVYKRASIVPNTSGSSAPYPSVEVWYADNVPSNSALEVTVTFSGSTWFAVVAADVAGTSTGGSIDAVSLGDAGSGMTSTDSIASGYANDLVVAIQCQVVGTGTLSSGGGFTHPSGFFEESGSGVPSHDISISGWELSQGSPGSANSDLSWAASEQFALATVAIRSPITWSTLAGKPAITVSPIGISGGGSELYNGGGDFGVDTPSTQTSGIQEALTAAAANGIMIVHLNSGQFIIYEQITWPAGWSGILEGSGATKTLSAGSETDGSHVKAMSSNGGLPSMLALENATVNTIGCTLRDIYWDAGSCAMSIAVVDFAQFAEASVNTRITRCVFDAGESDAGVSLIMDGNDDSVLDQCICINPNTVTLSGVALASSLQWKSPLGGNKIIGGKYDGMSLSFQNSTHLFVTYNTAVRVLTGSANYSRLNMYGCYKNVSSEPSAGSPIVQNDCSTLALAIDGGWFYIDAHDLGVPFFASTNVNDVIALSLRNCVLQSNATSNLVTNYLFGTSNAMSGIAPDSVADLDFNSVHFITSGGNLGINTQPQGNTAQGSGFGVAHIVADCRLTSQMATAAGATYTPFQDADLEISAEVFVDTAGSIATQILVSYKDEGGIARTRPIPVVGPSSTSWSTGSAPISAKGPWTGATLRIRAQALTPVIIETDPGGTYTGSSYTFGSTIKLLTMS
jgi:hypothetical protein